MFKQLGLVSFESTGRGKDAGRGLKLGAGPQSCGELRFCCGPWGSRGKVLKSRTSLHFKSFAGIEMSVRSESLLLMCQSQHSPSSNAGQKIHFLQQHVLLKD